MAEGISVVITTKNRPDSLACALTSLVNQQYRPLSVHILLNGTESLNEQVEKVISLLRAVNIEVTTDLNPRLSFAEAHAFLLNRAKYDAICRFDDDHIAQPDYLTQLAGPFFERSAGAIGGVMLHPEELRKDWEIEDLVNVLEEGSRAGMAMTHLQLHRLPLSEVLEVTDLYSSFLMSRQAVTTVGGIATCYRACGYREETDLTLRLHHFGYFVGIAPNAIVWHLRCEFGGERTSEKDWIAKVDQNKILFAERVLAFGISLSRLRSVYLRAFNRFEKETKTPTSAQRK